MNAQLIFAIFAINLLAALSIYIMWRYRKLQKEYAALLTILMLDKGFVIVVEYQGKKRQKRFEAVSLEKDWPDYVDAE